MTFQRILAAIGVTVAVTFATAAIATTAGAHTVVTSHAVVDAEDTGITVVPVPSCYTGFRIPSCSSEGWGWRTRKSLSEGPGTGARRAEILPVGRRNRCHINAQVAVQLGVGASLAPVQLARKPNWVLVPGPSAPLKLTLVAVTLAPLVVIVVFQDWVSVCPSAKRQETVQPLMALPPAVTATVAWKPPVHWFVIE